MSLGGGEGGDIPFPFSAKFDIPVTNTTGTTSNIQVR